jgi:hypothetical protein
MFVLNVGRRVGILAGRNKNCNEWKANKSHTQRKYGETNYSYWNYRGSCTLMSLPVWDLTLVVVDTRNAAEFFHLKQLGF